MKLTWSTARGDGIGRVRFQGAKKRPDEGKYLNALVENAVKEVLKTKKLLKAKVSNESGSEDKQEHFNFETLNIGGKICKSHTLYSDDAEVPETGTEAEKELYKISNLTNPTK